ncbi:MAG: DUF169 domain-containing protein [Aigarchaeota archaeon]|nr:DUF169 domain-containing protein [Aigarchaeota archaeon]MDW8092226.1 DUF169 domain-containing protein [Nitrososphaerota archaeon]
MELSIENYNRLAKELEMTLKLKKPLVAITFTMGDVTDVPESTDVVPSSCTFWALGQTRTFSTRPEQHLNCSVGAVTHGFKKAEEIGPGCGCADVDLLVDVGWVTAEDIRNLPSVRKQQKRVVYGPLRTVKFVPDVVVMFANAEQAMMISSATQFKVTGKPACIGIPISMSENNVVMSLGCTASRLRAGYDPSELVVFISGAIFPSLAERLIKLMEIEDKVASAVMAGL